MSNPVNSQNRNAFPLDEIESPDQQQNAAAAPASPTVGSMGGVPVEVAPGPVEVPPGYRTPPRSPREERTECTPIQTERKRKFDEQQDAAKKKRQKIMEGCDPAPSFHDNDKDRDLPPPPPPSIAVAAC